MKRKSAGVLSADTTLKAKPGPGAAPSAQDQLPAAAGRTPPQPVSYRVRAPLSGNQVNQLFAAAWPAHRHTDFQVQWAYSLGYLAAFSQSELIGYVNLAWDGGIHAFLLDTTVHPRFQRQGIGRELVRRAVQMAAERGIQWIHVDYEPELEHFYAACGFEPTRAGLIRLARANS